MTASPQPCVFYVDDDPQECELLQTVAENLPEELQIQTAESVPAAQEYLNKAVSGVYPSIRVPCLLLLDYNLGLHTGIDLLLWLKTQPELRFPVAIFSNCDREADILGCYQAGASYFLKKPQSYEALKTMLSRIRECLHAANPDFDWFRLIDEYRPSFPAAPHTAACNPPRSVSRRKAA